MSRQLIVEKTEANEDLPIPSYATEGSSGLDLHAAISVTIPPRKTAKVPTGIRIQLPAGHEAQIRSRSGLASKHSITVLNSPGTIDTDYRGEIIVILINLGEKAFDVERGMRIAQMIVCRYERMIVHESKVNETIRGSSGFGSTGI
jgi:dUTP pyrophosphatase